MTPNIDQAERLKVIAARINAGRDTYGGAGDAWHALGSVIGKYGTIEEMSVAAKLQFDVIKKQLEYGGIPVGAYGTFRIDAEVPKGCEGRSIRVQSAKTGEVRYFTFLASVGEGYEVIPHVEGFKLLDAVVGSIGGAHYETMGSLDFGRVVWGQINPNISIRVGDDESKVYMTFCTSHDGSKPFDIFETGTRMVCRNTYRIGNLKRLAATLRVKHTKNAQVRIANLKTELEEIKSVALSMQDKLTWLSRKKVTKDSVEKVFDRLFPKKQTEDGEEESSTRRDNILGTILERFERNDGDTFPGQRGTAYSLWNGITGYVDHDRSTKGDGKAVSATFGSGDTLKRNALAVIMEEAEGMLEKPESIQVNWTDLGMNVK